MMNYYGPRRMMLVYAGMNVSRRPTVRPRNHQLDLTLWDERVRPVAIRWPLSVSLPPTSLNMFLRILSSQTDCDCCASEWPSSCAVLDILPCPATPATLDCPVTIGTVLLRCLVYLQSISRPGFSPCPSVRLMSGGWPQGQEPSQQGSCFCYYYYCSGFVKSISRPKSVKKSVTPSLRTPENVPPQLQKHETMMITSNPTWLLCLFANYSNFCSLPIYGTYNEQIAVNYIKTREKTKEKGRRSRVATFPRCCYVDFMYRKGDERNNNNNNYTFLRV